MGCAPVEEGCVRALAATCAPQWYVTHRAPLSCPRSVDVFVGYVEGRVEQLPWCEQAIDKQGESGYILEGLKWLNSHGFLTINR